MFLMPKKERYIEVPEGGWEPKTFYAVLVSVGPSNPVWGGVFYSGYLDGPNGEPGGYASVWSGGTGESTTPFHAVHFLRVLHKLNVPHGHIREEDIARG